MARPSDDSFYSDLPAFRDFVDVADSARYRPAPATWLVVITDVKGSTKAIEAGRYKDVNALGVASIVALRNAMGGLPIPYVFGGDGATLLVPATRRDAVERALRGIRKMAREAFDLEMRAGIVGVRELREAGFDVVVARYQASDHVDLAMLGGAGLAEAERRMKGSTEDGDWLVDGEGPGDADFRGFECRWRPIPSRRGSVVSLMVHASDAERADASAIYRRVLDGIEGVLAEAAPGRPVSPEALELQKFGDPFDQEARIRSGGRSGPLWWLRSLIAKLAAVVGAILMRRGWSAFGFPGAVYRDEVSANTDFRKFDDMLRMVIDVTPEQRKAIEQLLEKERVEGHIAYGMHDAPTSIMTCAIGDYHGDHVHFVDGSGGGYALAAKQLKEQLRTTRKGR